MHLVFPFGLLERVLCLEEELGDHPLAGMFGKHFMQAVERYIH